MLTTDHHEKRNRTVIILALTMGFIFLSVTVTLSILLYIEVNKTSKHLDTLVNHAETDLKKTEDMITLLESVVEEIINHQNISKDVLEALS